jgi:hypothetical protein
MGTAIYPPRILVRSQNPRPDPNRVALALTYFAC